MSEPRERREEREALSFGSALRNLRVEHGLSLRETAVLLGTNVVRLGEVERGVEPEAEYAEFRDLLQRKGRAVEAARFALEARVRAFIAAEDAVEREAARAKQPGANAWSSGPVVRRVNAVESLRRALDECDRVRKIKARPRCPVTPGPLNPGTGR